MHAYAIHTQHLSRHFAAIRAVDDLSLDVPRGIVFGFLGPNGSGKTTTIRLLLGLLEPQQGQAEVLGFDTRRQAGQIRKHAGALLEHTGLYERLSAEDNLEFYGRINRMPAGERRVRIRGLLTHFGLWERRRERIGQWSRGMRQKVAIARAMLHRPDLIFLDEPTAGLDPVAAAGLRDDIATLVERDGVTVFLNTHNLPEAERMCAQIGVIRNGRLITVGSPDQIRSGPSGSRLEITGIGFSEEVLAQLRRQRQVEAAVRKNGHLEVRLSDPGDSAAVVACLVGAGAQVEEVVKVKASLESAFLKMMEEGNDAR